MIAGRWHFGKPGSDEISFGDRASVLVIIGVEMTAERKKFITEALNSALLTDDEMADGIRAFKDKTQTHPWRSMEDPFFGGKGPEEMWELKFRVDADEKAAEPEGGRGSTQAP